MEETLRRRKDVSLKAYTNALNGFLKEKICPPNSSASHLYEHIYWIRKKHLSFLCQYQHRSRQFEKQKKKL